MTDAIVIVLTLALAALVLWLPIAWLRKPLPVRMSAKELARRVNAGEPWRLAWLDPDEIVSGVYVRPHMRKGRHVNGYTRRIKR